MIITSMLFGLMAELLLCVIIVTIIVFCEYLFNKLFVKIKWGIKLLDAISRLPLTIAEYEAAGIKNMIDFEYFMRKHLMIDSWPCYLYFGTANYERLREAYSNALNQFAPEINISPSDKCDRDFIDNRINDLKDTYYKNDENCNVKKWDKDLKNIYGGSDSNGGAS